MAGMHNMLLGLQAGTGGGGGVISTVDIVDPFGDGSGIALYKFNGDATDASGNFNGTASNITYDMGMFGQAGVFNGSNSYLNLGKTSAWNFTNFTISLWLKPNVLNTLLTAMSVHAQWTNNGSSSNSGYGINMSADGYPEFFWTLVAAEGHNPSYGTNGYVVCCRANQKLKTDVYTHVCITFQNGKTAKIYINGVLNTTVSSVASVHFNATYAGTNGIGKIATYSTSTFYFNGKIDQFRVLNRVLTEAEVAILYTETIAA